MKRLLFILGVAISAAHINGAATQLSDAAREAREKEIIKGIIDYKQKHYAEELKAYKEYKAAHPNSNAVRHPGSDLDDFAWRLSGYPSDED